MKRKLHFTALGAALLALLWISWPTKRAGQGDGGPSPTSAAAARNRSEEENSSSRADFRKRQVRISPHRPSRTLADLVTGGDFAKLTPAQLEAYLSSHHRDADSLLAAHILGKDDAYLREALERFPGNSQVLLASIRQGSDPAGRLQAIEAFKRADPNNALGNSLAAKALLDSGKPEEAAAEMLLAKGKPFDDFMLQFCQNTEEAYLSAGIPPLEAKVTSLYSATAPEVIQLRGLGKELAKQSAASAAAGDSQRAGALIDIQMELARNLEAGVSIVDQLVGMVIEKGAIKGNDSPESLARLEEIDLQKKAMTAGAMQISEMMKDSSIPDSDWLLYFDRSKLFGEATANDWILKKHPAPP